MQNLRVEYIPKLNNYTQHISLLTKSFNEFLIIVVVFHFNYKVKIVHITLQSLAEHTLLWVSAPKFISIHPVFIERMCIILTFSFLTILPQSFSFTLNPYFSIHSRSKHAISFIFCKKYMLLKLSENYLHIVLPTLILSSAFFL